MPKTHETTARTARKQTHRRAKRPRIVATAHSAKLSRATQTTLIAGAAVVAAGAAATAAFVMRRQMGRLALNAAAEAATAGHAVGVFGQRMGQSIGREARAFDLSRLMTYAGLQKRPSLPSRLLLPMGVLATLAVVAGSTLLLVAPKLRVAREKAAGPRNFAGSTPSHNPTHNSVGEVEGPTYHAAK